MFTVKIFRDNGYEAHSCDFYRLEDFRSEDGTLQGKRLLITPKMPGKRYEVLVQATAVNPPLIYVENAAGKTIDRVKADLE